MRIPRGRRRARRDILRELIEGWNEFRSREWLWVIVVCASVPEWSPSRASPCSARGREALPRRRGSLRGHPRRSERRLHRGRLAVAALASLAAPVRLGDALLPPAARNRLLRRRVHAGCDRRRRFLSPGSGSRSSASTGTQPCSSTFRGGCSPASTPTTRSARSSSSPSAWSSPGPLGDRLRTQETLWLFVGVGLASVGAALLSRRRSDATTRRRAGLHRG